MILLRTVSSPRSKAEGILSLANGALAETATNLLNVTEPPRDAGQASKDAEPPVHVHDAQGILIGDNSRQSNFFTYVGPPGAGGPERRARPAFTSEVESPYRGLMAFGERDSPFFFGQDAAADEVLDRLRARADAPALLVISGVSGAGKSSLLRAGVLPRIGEIAPDGTPWPHLVLTPARSPLSELAAHAAQRTGKDAATLRQTLREDPAGFALTALEAAGIAGDDGARRRLLLVVDQFEQVFTQCGDEAERRAFIAALHAAATVGHGGRQVPAALVVVVVRADFEARCAGYEELVGPVQERYFLPPMTGRQLRLAITEPARVAGASVDDALVGELIQAVRAVPSPGSAEAATGGMGVLPHLSHALDQAWRNRAGDGLTLDDYVWAGGIEGSIGASADAAYALLTPAQQEAARQVFLRLTATSASGTDTGDRASVAELTGDKSPAEIADVQAVLEAFAAQRLLTLAADSVELGHEVLLTAWPLLRDSWLAETHADRIVRTQLRTAAAEWDGHGRDPAYLYRGTQLVALREAAVRWSADPGRHLALAGTDRDFLHAANRAAGRASIRRKIIASALALLLVASLTAAGIAVNAAATARQQTALARQQTALAASGQLAVRSETFDTADPVTAALLAAASWRIDRSNPTALESLLNAYAQPDHATLDTGEPVNDVAYSRNGDFLATVGSDGKVRLWDVSTRAQIGAPITVPSSGDLVGGVAFSPDGKTLATSVGSGPVRLWDVSTRAQIGVPITVPGKGGSDVFGVAFSPDGKTLATADGDGTVRLWDVSTRAQIGAPITVPGTANGVFKVAFSPDGKTLATADDNGIVRLWDVSTRAQIGAPITVPGTPGGFGVAFSPDGKTLATAGTDGTARLWDITTRTQTRTITVPDTAYGATGVAFSPDGKTLATADGDGTVRLWDITAYSQIGAPITVPGKYGVVGEAFSPDGRLLATADGDGTVRLWDVSTRAQIGAPITIPDGVFRVAFSPDGKTLATTSDAGAIQLWDVSTRAQVGAPITIPDDGGVPGMTFSPDGKTLATTSDNNGTGRIRLWDVSTRAQVGAPITVPGNGRNIGGVAFSPDGKTLATGDSDGTVRLWDVSARAQIGAPITVPGNGGYVSGVAFSPDGRLLATGDSDGTVRLWDVSTRAQIGAPITVPGNGGGGVGEVAFSPDGKTLGTIGSDAAIRLWNVAFPANPVNAVCSIAGRSLTRHEWSTYAPSEPFQQVCPAI
jgi:WD40 repeat protein